MGNLGRRYYVVWILHFANFSKGDKMRLTLSLGCVVSGLLVALLIGLTKVEAAEGTTFNAVHHARRTIYHSPQTTGYTCWTGARWKFHGGVHTGNGACQWASQGAAAGDEEVELVSTI